MSLGRFAGTCLYWLAWPAYKIYFRLSERTRVVLVHNGQVLVMQQWIGNGRWHLPGGGLHRGERPVDGAIRELREETGILLTAPQLESLGVQQYRQYGQHFTYHVFAYQVESVEPLRRQRHEVAVLQWLPVADLTPHTALNDTLQSIQLVRDRTRLLQ